MLRSLYYFWLVVVEAPERLSGAPKLWWLLLAEAHEGEGTDGSLGLLTGKLSLDHSSCCSVSLNEALTDDLHGRRLVVLRSGGTALVGLDDDLTDVLR